MKECGCKGQRFCLICRKDLILDNNLICRKQFFYCHLCEDQAFRLDLEDHNLHLNQNLVEFKDFIKISGLFVFDEAINCYEENELVKLIDQNEWCCSQSGRLKQDFGPKINFKKKKLNTNGFIGLPSLNVQVIEKLIDKVQSIKERLKDFMIVEICNLEYKSERGSQIEPHFDCDFFWGRLVTLNLLSSTKLILTKDFSNQLEVGLDNKFEIVINLNRRSLLILDKEARYNWKHEIRPEHIQNRRISVTYRELSKQLLPGGNSNYKFKNEIDQLLNLASNRI